MENIEREIEFGWRGKTRVAHVEKKRVEGGRKFWIFAEDNSSGYDIVGDADAYEIDTDQKLRSLTRFYLSHDDLMTEAFRRYRRTGRWPWWAERDECLKARKKAIDLAPSL